MDPVAALLATPLPDLEGGRPLTGLADPSPSQRRQAYLALRAARTALAAQEPLKALGEAMEDTEGGKRPTDRSKALSSATALLATIPAGTRLADPELAEAEQQLTPAGRGIQLPDHPRLPVITPAGRLWFLETHPATFECGTEDPWMSRRLAAHHAVGAASRLEYAGVAVLTPRVPHLSRHALVDTSHQIGSCDVCLELVR